MQFQVEIATGVVAGIFTAMLIFSAKGLWLRVIAPWYAALRYQGADIAGSWYAKVKELPTDFNPDTQDADEVEGIGSSTFSLILRQSAHRISGSLQFSFEGTDRRFNLDYDVEGEYWEGYIALYCKSKDKKMFSQAYFFMKLISNGLGLYGSFSFRNAATDQVQTVSLRLDRN
ncbi:hypothetical protein [Marinobacter maritimus]|uniref:hypothetical protein n=1 Tax=Marinobacter maritimus TaxID=277961 RepID=UPI0011A8CC18|nr:hypothetical protein [Marinobacter maritimus]